jgi:hypothetical protein
MQKVNDSKSWEQKQYKDMIEDLKKIETIYVVGLRKSNNPNWDKGIWRHFGIYYIKDNKLERVFIYHTLKESQKPSSWDQDTNCFTDRVLGSDRTHEIVYSLYNKVYPYNPKKPQNNDALYKMPKIEFLSMFDGNNDDFDEQEQEEGEP